MKFRRKLLLIAILITSLALLVACGNSEKSKLVGRWELVEDVTILGFFTFPKGSQVEFYKDGNVDFMGTGAKYEIVENKIKLYDDNESTYHEYELEGDKLVFYIEGNGVLAGKSVALEFARVNK